MEHDSTPARRSLFDRFFAYMDRLLPSDRLFLYILLLIFVSASIYAVSKFNEEHIVSVPSAGGTLVEGVIGTPRFVNPILAITRADHDLVTLIYSGLLKLSEEGSLTNDLAESITVSDDGLTYNIILRNDVVFHDNTPLTSEDVAFTIGLIQNPELKSPLRGNWNGVQVELINEHELNILLESPYAPFLENLTVGILPKHIWNSLTTEELPFSQHNTEPIGTGPYMLETINRSESGLIDEYLLTAFQQADRQVNISNVTLRFYPGEAEIIEALVKKEILATAALGPATLQNLKVENLQTISQPLPRVFSIFFNQNKSDVLRDKSAREALEILIDRDELINTVLLGYGSSTTSPVPPGFLEVQSSNTRTISTTTEARVATARNILFAGDWVETESGTWQKEIDGNNSTLAITLRTANTEVFQQTTDYLSSVWSAFGIEVNVEQFEQSDLVQSVIRPRDYEALLFGADVGRPLDFYPFWHSSQREDPGLNVALYTNITVDRLLGEIRTTQDTETRVQDVGLFITELEKELPAIFLFSPSLVYVLSDNISTVPMQKIARPSERFSNISKWYMEESKVWPMFR